MHQLDSLDTVRHYPSPASDPSGEDVGEFRWSRHVRATTARYDDWRGTEASSRCLDLPLCPQGVIAGWYDRDDRNQRREGASVRSASDGFATSPATSCF